MLRDRTGFSCVIHRRPIGTRIILEGGGRGIGVRGSNPVENPIGVRGIGVAAPARARGDPPSPLANDSISEG